MWSIELALGSSVAWLIFLKDRTRITMKVHSFSNHTKVLKFNPCISAFIVQQHIFYFFADYLRNEDLVRNKTCKYVVNTKNYACRGIYSICEDPENMSGYILLPVHAWTVTIGTHTSTTVAKVFFCFTLQRFDWVTCWLVVFYIDAYWVNLYFIY